MSNLSRVLSQMESGDPSAEKLLPLVYDEFRNLPAVMLAKEMPGQSLQATALVHEAYIRLIGTSDAIRWDHRGHFFAAAAEAMRRILVDRARRKAAAKHGGEFARIDLEFNVALAPEIHDDLIALDDALSRLAIEHPLEAQLVKLRHFAGLRRVDANADSGRGLFADLAAQVESVVALLGEP